MSHQAEPARLPPAEVSTSGADRTVSRADFDPFHQDYRSRLLPSLSCQHLLPYGEIRLDVTRRLDLTDAATPLDV